MKHKTNTMHPIFLIGSVFAALAGIPVMAATMFSTDFNAGTLDANLTQTTDYPSNSPLTLGGTASFGGTGFAGARSYVGTTDSNYGVATTNWTATIEVQAGTFTGTNQLFFGLGTGTSAGIGDPQYGEPAGTTGQPAAYITAYPQSFAERSVAIKSKTPNGEFTFSLIDDAAFDVAAGTTGGIIDGSFYRYTMAYDSTMQTLTFDIDQISGFGGTVTSSGAGTLGSRSLPGMGFDGTNSKIIFGGYSNTFDNLSVIPEPHAALLGGLGMLCLLRRRR